MIATTTAGELKEKKAENVNTFGRERCNKQLFTELRNPENR